MSGETIIAFQPGATPANATTEQVLGDQPLSVLSPPGLASILVPCCGQLEYTKLCVPALLGTEKGSAFAPGNLGKGEE
jgi:hypothetical protein